MHGLTKQDIQYITEAIRRFPEIEEAIIFGSRAIGNNKKSSDVDLCIKGSKINSKIVLALRDLLDEEYPLPYFFDVIHYEQITNEELKKHINEIGKRLW
jgi:predicted nucleotidyltransferase